MPGDDKKLSKLVTLNQSLEYALDQEKKKSGELETMLRGLRTEKKLNKYKYEEHGFNGDLKASEIESQKEFLCRKMIQEQVQKLKEDKKELEQEVTKLKSHMERNIEGQLGKYKKELEEHFNNELQTSLKQINLFLQKETEHRDHLFELRETQRNEMELRIKDLESEVSQSRTQNNSTKTELEKFKQLYLEEHLLRKSLSSELNDLCRAIEMLEETNNRLLVIQQNSTGNSRPIGEGPLERNLHSNLGLNRNFMPREMPISYPQSSCKTLKKYLTKFQQKLQNVETQINEAPVTCLLA
uniref:ankyrin repeat domain-containing protein 26-like isoform X3 n=1 Tax=Ictidomys tridecemlineatus TaxID=43179 RepID=UPI001A9FBE1B|nr:ankyrin repeat domain-containing protein 26-like isoform X3 [Ictidomys tridecemlineatus]